MVAITVLSWVCHRENIGDDKSPLWVQLDQAEVEARSVVTEEFLKSKDKQWLMWQRSQVRNVLLTHFPPCTRML